VFTHYPRGEERELLNQLQTGVRRGAAIILAAVIAAALFLSTAMPVSAETNASGRTVRVGYFYNGDFMSKADDGSYKGYDIAYYYTLAGYAGWNLQFVEYNGLNDALAGLENGEIDVLSGLSKTEERVSKYLISSMKMCTSQIAVQTRADDDRFAAGDTSTMTDMTCGILKSSNVVTLFTNWCEENGLSPHIHEYDSIQQRNAAFASGEVDAIAAGSTVEGAQKIAEFPALDLYFMFNSEQGAVKAEADRAMGMLSLENPTFSTDLFAEYFPSSRNDTPSFSAAEKAFISGKGEIKVAVLRDDAPFSEVSENGEVTGVLPEYYARLASVIGTSFRCVPCSSKEDALAALASGEVDLVGKFEDNIYDANDQKVILSNAYLKMNLVQITRAGTTDVTSAAVPECNFPSISKTLADAGSAITLVSCLNSAKSFEKLKSGNTDAVICAQPAATWLLNRNRASDYVVQAFGGDTWNVSCAFSYDADGNTLRGIIDKTIMVDGGYINQLIMSDTLEDSANLSSFFDKMPVTMIASFAVASICMLVIAVLALIIIIRRHQMERKLNQRQVEIAAMAEANKAKHNFFGTVSHDMRTPLNGIMGFTNLALECDDPAKIRDYLSKIKSSGEILGNLVNDTLIMSRVENGKYVLKPEPAETNEIFSGIMEPIRELAAEKNVVLKDNVQEIRCRRVLVDRLSLQKIFLNLLSNAVKFTPPGGTVTFEYRLEPPDGEQPESVIVVSDTGKGISREFLPRIFEPFSQESAAEPDNTGSGMGLSIVKSIVDAMDGTIDVVSAPGKGTTFTVRLRLREIPKEDGASPIEQSSRGDFLKGKHALVCEDNALNLEILKSILERHGAAVTGKENGKAGAEAFAASNPGFFDIILLDLRMPVMDGVTAAEEIRGLSRSDAKSAPIIAVSADAYPENVEECLAAGMNAHISKPINEEELLETLERYLL